MTAGQEKERRITRPVYLGLRVNGEIAGPLPTADRLKVIDPSTRLGWLELRYRGELVGFTAAEDDV